MFQLIKNYVSTLTKEKLDTFAKKNNINLNDSELDFLYRFITRNYEALYANPHIDLRKYAGNFSEENFKKIMELVSFYKKKYANYIN